MPLNIGGTCPYDLAHERCNPVVRGINSPTPILHVKHERDQRLRTKPLAFIFISVESHSHHATNQQTFWLMKDPVFEVNAFKHLLKLTRGYSFRKRVSKVRSWGIVRQSKHPALEYPVSVVKFHHHSDALSFGREVVEV